MVFVLDNYDSFTYNLVQYMGELGAEMVIRRNDELTPEEVAALQPRPHPHLARALHPAGGRHLDRADPPLCRKPAGRRPARPDPGRLPRPSGASARPSAATSSAPPKLMHGKTSEVEHDGRTIFEGIPSADDLHPLSLADRRTRRACRTSSKSPPAPPTGRRRSWRCGIARCPSKACSSTPRAC